MLPPVAKKISKLLEIHGHNRTDDYFWLNDRNNPAAIEYLKAENEYTDYIMQDTMDLQKKLFQEIVGRIKQDDMSVPYKDNGYYYYTRFEEEKEYPVYCRKKESLEAPEEILLNVNEMTQGFEYYQVAGFSISPDNTLMAYGVDTVGRRLYTLYFKNLLTGKWLKDEIPETTGSAAWANDNYSIFYDLKDIDTLRSYKINKHKLGNPVSEDKNVFEETNETYHTYVYKSKSKKYLIIGSSSTLSDEYRIIDASRPDSDFRIFSKREKNLEYDIEHFEDKFFIRTNLDARNFRLMETSIDATGRENWQEVMSHRDSVLLEGFELFKDYLVVEERIEGLSKLHVIDIRNHSEYYIDMKEQAYAAWISINPEFDTSLLRFGYSSLTTPSSTFDFNLLTKERRLLKQQEVVGDFDPDNYFIERVSATAPDGVKIPVSMVYRKGKEKDSNNPLLLYGYGSYGHSIEPTFSSVRLSLLDRGFIYAIAHIRGGEELGRHWYEDGKLFKKKNTFTDFISCAEFLINEKYTSPDKLFAMGGSAGGLLIGAVINMRPDLFKGIIASVPFVDVITTMLDEEIPLTTGEYDEWGNPNLKEYYHYMLSYSPYDKVSAQDYPNVLVTTGLHDSQVQYWEPAKWVAKLRALKTDKNILLLHTNMGAGHSGTTGRFKAHRETALEYAFLLKILEIRDRKKRGNT